ncbi:NUDIX hydrolase [Xanthobacter sp. TB0139]|uniref:NUDIX hydrolase n=1 Tax=Xanthobacter sp. TB0139 TaxID=3459178 RepID=UPI004039CA3D
MMRQGAENPSAGGGVRPVVAASIAVFRGPHVLLVRRGSASGCDNAGLWSLPGGKVEPGETVADAALRELHEEVGVEAEITGLAAVRNVILRDASGRLTAHYVVVAHAAQWRRGTPQCSGEAQEVGWFLPQEISALPATEGLAEVVVAACCHAQAPEPGRLDRRGAAMALDPSAEGAHHNPYDRTKL